MPTSDPPLRTIAAVTQAPLEEVSAEFSQPSSDELRERDETLRMLEVEAQTVAYDASDIASVESLARTLLEFAPLQEEEREAWQLLKTYWLAYQRCAATNEAAADERLDDTRRQIERCRCLVQHMRAQMSEELACKWTKGKEPSKAKRTPVPTTKHLPSVSKSQRHVKGKETSPDMLMLGSGGRASAPVTASLDLAPRRHRSPSYNEDFASHVADEMGQVLNTGLYGHALTRGDAFAEHF